ncbi:MAG: MATE family efflux transporter [Clostridiales bacterium]|nr:MATE family efflux transporter [Clostridiales bacterium]
MTSILKKAFGEQEIEDSFSIRFSTRTLLALILPLIAEQFLSILMGIMDSILVSSLGDASVSGVSLVDMIFILFINIFGALATGGAVIASRCIGAKQPDQASKSACALMIISLAASLLMLGIVAIADTALLRLLYGSIEDDVMEASTVYMRTTMLSFPFIALYSACAALFRSMGNSKITMIASTAANLLNVAGNAVAIFVLHWGVFGAALSTVVSRGLLMLFFLIRIADQRLDIRLDYRALFTERPDGTLARSILGVGLPGSLESGTFQLGRILVLSIISTFGTAQITANAVANNIDTFGVMSGFAFNLAIITVVGQCVGANDWRAVKYYTAKMLRMSYAAFVAFNAILFACLPLILHLYKVSDEAASLALILIFIHNGSAILLWTPSFVTPNAMKAAGDARFVMIVAVVSMFVFRVGGSMVLGSRLGMGAIGVWCAMVADWIVRSAVFAVRWRRTLRTHGENSEFRIQN